MFFNRLSAGKLLVPLSVVLYALFVVILPLQNSFHSSNVLVRGADDVENYGTVIGIDLGTTYSCVAVMKMVRLKFLLMSKVTESPHLTWHSPMMKD